MKNCTLRRVWVGVQSSPPLFYVFALMLMLLFGSSRAKADIYDSYVFANSPLTILNGLRENIAGSFTFDATTGNSTTVSITLSHGASPYDGTYTTSSDTCALPCTAIYGVLGGSTLDVFFAKPLGVSPDDLKETEWTNLSVSPYSGIDYDPGTSPTGSAVFSSAVPEPGSVIQLMMVVAMVGFLTRRKLVVGVLSKRSPNPTA